MKIKTDASLLFALLLPLSCAHASGITGEHMLLQAPLDTPSISVPSYPDYNMLFLWDPGKLAFRGGYLSLQSG